MGLLRVRTYNNPVWGIFISVMLDLGWLPRLPSTQMQRTGRLSLVSGAEFALPLISRCNAINQTILWNVGSSWGDMKKWVRRRIRRNSEWVEKSSGTQEWDRNQRGRIWLGRGLIHHTLLRRWEAEADCKLLLSDSSMGIMSLHQVSLLFLFSLSRSIVFSE